MKIMIFALAAMLPLAACSDTGSDAVTSDSAAAGDDMMATPYAPANEPIGDTPPAAGTTGQEGPMGEGAAMPPAGRSAAPPPAATGADNAPDNRAGTADAAPPR
ncbi:hypothetical protein [Sphingopyxis terrae]|uniref:Lipoprotein n=1 Tax=Sphingopyxis terrae subsp. ummariensis TaxID=429001 RepID=A0A1Y6FTN0_9SPHN|nr:hypothetical protein [Sphingopyxis terrae]PCF91327.1 hypothetical protein CPA46_07670 [Sphingopyxis terrae subsp. ummariensis]SMQ76500.1 hypothetical protein SAMN06295984_1942 [Sphingopyxis terrae subsp. ummariensis]